MDQLSFKTWNELKAHLLEKYPHLTEEDLIYEAGKEGELLKRLQQKVEKNENEIKGWLSFMG